MEVFGIIGMSLGAFGFIFGLAAYSELQTLKKRVAELEAGGSSHQE